MDSELKYETTAVKNKNYVRGSLEDRFIDESEESEQSRYTLH